MTSITPSMPTLAHTLPLLAAQLVWWATVLQVVPLATGALLIQLALHWRCDRATLPTPAQLLLICSTGLLVDGFTVFCGWVQFRAATAIGLPLWLVLLWLSFALTVPRLQRWLSTWQQTLILMTLAPLSYYVGASMGAATIHRAVPYLATLAIAWLLLSLLWRRVVPVTARTAESS